MLKIIRVKSKGNGQVSGLVAKSIRTVSLIVCDAIMANSKSFFEILIFGVQVGFFLCYFYLQRTVFLYFLICSRVEHHAMDSVVCLKHRAMLPSVVLFMMHDMICIIPLIDGGKEPQLA